MTTTANNYLDVLDQVCATAIAPFSQEVDQEAFSLARPLTL